MPRPKTKSDDRALLKRKLKTARRFQKQLEAHIRYLEKLLALVEGKHN